MGKSITNKDWDVFVKTGVITEKTISKIASIIKRGKDLSMREIAIYREHARLIEKKLKDFA